MTTSPPCQDLAMLLLLDDSTVRLNPDSKDIVETNIVKTSLTKTERIG
jgi:hypothetical protein